MAGLVSVLKSSWLLLVSIKRSPTEDLLDWLEESSETCPLDRSIVSVSVAAASSLSELLPLADPDELLLLLLLLLLELLMPENELSLVSLSSSITLTLTLLRIASIFLRKQ